MADGVFDFLFFSEQTFATVSLNRNDRLRMIQTDKPIIDVVEQTVREVWAVRGGIQEVLDDRPLCYELKLKGTPWWASGEFFYLF